MSPRAKTILGFLKDWMLVVAMMLGASIYFTYRAIPALHPAGPTLNHIIRILQPSLIFCMILLSFCKIEPRELRPHRWQGWLLLIQSVSFLATAAILIIFPQITGRLSLEAFMLCMICPTATAAPVVTDKLGGNIAGLLTYTIAINLVTAILVPLALPFIHPVEGLTFFPAFLKILRKVFPILIMPCLLAWAIRYWAPRLHKWILAHSELPFYLFAVSLTLAITTATRIIVINENSGAALLGIAAASLLSCILQFRAGKKVGERYSERVTAGQSLGQKNTVFAMWLGYTFMDPMTSVAGGFYSVWHNVFNSWQLYKHRKKSLSLLE